MYCGSTAVCMGLLLSTGVDLVQCHIVLHGRPRVDNPNKQGNFRPKLCVGITGLLANICKLLRSLLLTCIRAAIWRVHVQHNHILPDFCGSIVRFYIHGLCVIR